MIANVIKLGLLTAGLTGLTHHFSDDIHDNLLKNHPKLYDKLEDRYIKAKIGDKDNPKLSDLEKKNLQILHSQEKANRLIDHEETKTQLKQDIIDKGVKFTGINMIGSALYGGSKDFMKKMGNKKND
jgi:hypothetical protein